MRSLLLLSAVVTSACLAAASVQPVNIRLGEDACAHCRMSIIAANTVAQIVVRGEEPVMLALLFDLAALGAASLLRSGAASRLLIVATLINPVDAARTGVLLAIDGTSAFDAASLALLRFTGGLGMAVALIVLSLVTWLVTPLWLATRALARADI